MRFRFPFITQRTGQKDKVPLPRPLPPERLIILEEPKTITVNVKKVDKRGNPAVVELEGKDFCLVEKPPKTEEQEFGFVYRKIYRRIEKSIEKHGYKRALRFARINSYVDIVTSMISMTITGITILASLFLAGYLGYKIISSKNGEAVKEMKDDKITQTVSFFDILVYGWGGTIIFGLVVGAYLSFKQFLDYSQRLTINIIRNRLKEENEVLYYKFTPLEARFRENDDAERIEGGTVSMLFRHIPIFGSLIEGVIKDYYNIKYEKAQLRAVRDMEKLFDEL